MYLLIKRIPVFLSILTFLYPLQEEVDAARQKQEEAKAALLAATQTPHHHYVQENENCDENDEMTNGHVSRDLQTDDDIVDPVEERRTLAERSERLHDQLKVCKRDHHRITYPQILLLIVTNAL